MLRRMLVCLGMSETSKQDPAEALFLPDEQVLESMQTLTILRADRWTARRCAIEGLGQKIVQGRVHHISRMS